MPLLSPLKEYGISIASVLAVSFVCYGFAGMMGYRVVALLLLVVVSLLAISFSLLPVLVAAGLSALIWDFFFIPPRFTIHVNTTEDTILLVMYFVVAMINGILTYRIRKAEKISRLKEERAASVTLYNTVLNSLSHELRTPIAAIMGSADNLQSNTRLSETDKAQLVDEIFKAGLRLNQQVENLLNISRLESGHMAPSKEWCDVPEVVHAVTQRVEENNPGRRIHISLHPALPLCFTDEGMLEQILYNLLNNAAIHTGPDSRIDISGTCHTDLLEFIIEDTGQGFIGMKGGDALHKLTREGTAQVGTPGLGLSIVKGFTEALNGSVTMQRGIVGGTRFTLAFPVKTSTIHTTDDEAGNTGD